MPTIKEETRKLDTRYKSQQLALAIGWRRRKLTQAQRELFYSPKHPNAPTRVWQDTEGYWLSSGLPDFYLAGNMIFAWNILNWAWEKSHADVDSLFEHASYNGIIEWSSVLDLILDGGLPMREVQANILDTIFDLAVEAKMMKVE